MRFIAVLNKDGGTLRTMDLDAFTARMKEVLESGGHTLEVEIVRGGEVVAALNKAAARRSIDVLIAGGGDGTISAASAALMDRKMALAILPAGTMNLFARSLGIPQSLEAALAAFADSEIRAVDVATANGMPFVHQFSIGLHAKMVHLRDAMEFSSRLGKIGASMKAAYRTVLSPPSLKATIDVDGTSVLVRATGISVTNNLFGEGHLPYADKPDGGVLGVYIALARQRSEMFRLALDMMRGRWRDSPHVEIKQGQRVIVTLPTANRRFKAVVDGELRPLKKKTVLEIHPGSLNVFSPRLTVQAEAA